MKNIPDVANDILIDTEKLPQLIGDQKNTLAEFVYVLEEVTRVARLLEADREVNISRAPRILLKLQETLVVMAGKFSHAGERVEN